MRDTTERINPGHRQVRGIMRVVGPMVGLAGLACVVVAFVDFFGAFAGGGGPPRLFWLFFIGLPLLFVGVSLTMFAFMGAVARFAAQEQAPVAADTFNALADETRGGVRTVVGAIREGMSGEPNGRCASCGTANDSGARFCDACGESLSLACDACGTANDADARFCDGCGGALAAAREA
ncbi:MAG: zinc ribbon domain-containing protein [Planctomycetota bacterium]|nr:MAG: zinc ribbon domain-containing protein [Planctomycetota bacterium]